MSEVILKIAGLKVAYGGIKAIKGIDIEVKQGELITLIGANGAGKTTTLKAITGTLPSAKVEGEIHYLGKKNYGRRAVQVNSAKVSNGARRAWDIHAHDYP